MISTIERHAEHPFAGRNTQQSIDVAWQHCLQLAIMLRANSFGIGLDLDWGSLENRPKLSCNFLYVQALMKASQKNINY